MQARLAVVVDRTHERDREGAPDDAARLAVRGEEQQRRHEHRGQDRQPAQPGNGPVVKVAVARPVDDSKPPRQPGDRRRDGERDQRGDEERPEGIELVHRAGGY
jgi:hypothetical protein